MTEVTGRTLHSGLDCRVRITRQDGPVTFLHGGVRIPALAEHVVSTLRSTTLGRDGAVVGTVEHVLAALGIRGWWGGLLIEVSRDELPILDGSAAEWLGLIDGLGEPPAPPAPFRPRSAVRVRDGAATAEAVPGAAELDVRVSYEHPLIGCQQWQGTPADYGELAAARTFGFLEEMPELARLGLARGATPDNCIVYGTGSTLGPPPAPDEPVRHKALDAVGDLHLLGRPLQARVSIVRGSHRLHARLLDGLLRAGSGSAAA